MIKGTILGMVIGIPLLYAILWIMGKMGDPKGGDHVIFAPVAGPPFVVDSERGRREGTLKDMENFVKLSQISPYLHTVGSEITVPTDVPIAYRHLETMYCSLATRTVSTVDVATTS